MKDVDELEHNRVLRVEIVEKARNLSRAYEAHASFFHT